LFKNQYEMWNVFQIDEALDSINDKSLQMRINFANTLKLEYQYYQAYNYLNNKPDSILNADLYKIEEMTNEELKFAYQNSVSKLRRINQSLDGNIDFLKTYETSLNAFKTEFHKKFALSIAIIVLFFVGAPLGAIVKKGGFGAPVVIACLLFMIYYVITEIGLSLIDSNSVSPIIGVWLATFILSPIAFVLMRSAALDSKVFDKNTWKQLFKFTTK
jgi:lipopolysaccharide export system permease protein